MLRGLSKGARCSRRNFRMRLLCWGSSLPSSRSTWADSSTFQAMPLQGIFEWNGLFFPAADTFERAFGSVEVFEIVKMLKDRLADIEGLSTTGAAGQFLEALFDGWGKANGQHRNLTIQ